jgi:hypothetical protein
MHIVLKGQIVMWISKFLENRRQRVVQGDIVAEWKSVISGVPQGSVLGPLLFVIFINDMPKNLVNKSKLYADDCKLLAIIRSISDSLILQNDINKLSEWCDTWQVKFNDLKCKVLHFGKRNPKYEYKLKVKGSDNWYILESSDCEKDLGVMLSSNLKWGKQVTCAVAKANSILGRIKNSFSYFDVEMAKLVYTVFVRPHLEFAIPVWSPYLECDIKRLESVQHRATRVVKGIKKMKYEDRLKIYGLTDLRTRRERGDLIQFYKYVNKKEEISFVEDIKFSEAESLEGPAGGLRKDGLTYRKELVKNCLQRENFLTNRVADNWNKLPVEVKNAKSLNSFKARIDRLGFGIEDIK